jgi:hypothetical protein
LASNETRGEGERFLFFSPYSSFLLASNETGGEWLLYFFPHSSQGACFLLAANQRGGEGEKFLFFFPLSQEPCLYLSSVRKRRKTIRKRRGE